MDMVLEWGSILTDWIDVVGNILVFGWGIETDLFLVWASKLTCFLRGGSKLVCFGVWVDNHLVSMYGSNLT